MKRLILLALFSLSLSLSAPAQAGKSSTITTVGVETFDNLFEEARLIDEAILTARTERKQARVAINDSLGLDKATSFADAITELRSRAPSGITVDTSGTLPKLAAEQTFPEDISASVLAVNDAVVRYGNLVQQLVVLPQSCQRIAQSLQGLSPESLKAELGGGTALEQLAKVSVYQTNIQEIGKLPEKVKRLVNNLRSDIQAVKSLFGR